MKTAILFEMMLLFGGTVVSKKAAGSSWQDLFLTGVLTKTATAVVIILAILLTFEEMGAGGVAVAFGGLIVLGYFLAAGGVLGTNLLQVEQSFFGTVPSTPTSLEGASSQNAAKQGV